MPNPGLSTSLQPAQVDVPLTLLLSVRPYVPFQFDSLYQPVEDWYYVNSTIFESYLIDFHNTFMLPLWVTEWACQNYGDINAQCSQTDVYSLMTETQSFMDNTEWVERYAWFGAMENLMGINQVWSVFFLELLERDAIDMDLIRIMH
jgi:hypothetical protein